MRYLRASEFQGPMKTGTKFPILFTCTDGSSREDVIVKFRESVWRGIFSLVGEHVAAHLAKDLGLRAAEIVMVDVDETMADVPAAEKYPQHAKQIRRSPGLNVGSVFVGPGFYATIPNEREMVKSQKLFTQVVGFDFVIQNFDRVRENPNYLRKGEQLILIDHEQAFGVADEHNSIEFTVDALALDPFLQHVFFPAIDLASDFDPLFSKLAALSDATINGYFEALPKEWKDERTKSLTAYVRWARDNASVILSKLLTLVKYEH